jgi:hypothetical protein
VKSVDLIEAIASKMSIQSFTRLLVFVQLSGFASLRAVSERKPRAEAQSSRNTFTLMIAISASLLAVSERMPRAEFQEKGDKRTTKEKGDKRTKKATKGQASTRRGGTVAWDGSPLEWDSMDEAGKKKPQRIAAWISKFGKVD